MKRSVAAYLAKAPDEKSTSTAADDQGLRRAPAQWAQSSVSTFGVRYSHPVTGLSTQHGVEAMVEGSDMSRLREGMYSNRMLFQPLKFDLQGVQ